MNVVDFQIGQCRTSVEVERTKDFYSNLPRITENCNCGDCQHFENVVVRKDIRLFKILMKMGVDLTRQPNISPSGVSNTGETDKFQRSYMGYYKLFGKLGKTQHTPKIINEAGKLTAVEFREAESDAFVQYSIKQNTNDELTVDFFLECERKRKERDAPQHSV